MINRLQLTQGLGGSATAVHSHDVPTAPGHRPTLRLTRDAVPASSSAVTTLIQAPPDAQPGAHLQQMVDALATQLVQDLDESPEGKQMLAALMQAMGQGEAP